MKKLKLLPLALLLSTMVPTVTASADTRSKEAPDNSAVDELAKIQGVWSRKIQTEDGTFRIVKQHKGQATTVTVFDSNEKVVAEKESKFRLEKTAKVRVFTFYDNVTTAGPQKGQTAEVLHLSDRRRFILGGQWLARRR